MASECYLETDAAPLPPRTKPEPTTHEQIVEEPDDNEEIKKGSNAKTTSNVKNKQATTVVHGNSTSVIKSTNVRIGTDVYYNFGGKFSERFNNNPFSKPTTEAEEILLTKSIAKLLDNDERLKPEHLELVSEHVGEPWKALGAKLGFSTGQVQQFYIDHNKYKIQEVIYQMLLNWTQRNPENATISFLMEILWNSDLKYVVKIFSEHNFNQYDD